MVELKLDNKYTEKKNAVSRLFQPPALFAGGFFSVVRQIQLPLVIQLDTDKLFFMASFSMSSESFCSRPLNNITPQITQLIHNYMFVYIGQDQVKYAFHICDPVLLQNDYSEAFVG